jgi:hypothetical protein
VRRPAPHGHAAGALPSPAPSAGARGGAARAARACVAPCLSLSSSQTASPRGATARTEHGVRVVSSQSRSPSRSDDSEPPLRHHRRREPADQAGAAGARRAPARALALAELPRSVQHTPSGTPRERGVATPPADELRAALAYLDQLARRK